MFLVILLSPLVLLACFVLPFIGTIFSKEQPAKWIAFWLIQIVASWTIIPFFGLIFDCDIQMLIKVIISLGLIFALNLQLVGTITAQINNVVGIVEQQKKNAEQKIAQVAKQYGLTE